MILLLGLGFAWNAKLSSERHPSSTQNTPSEVLDPVVGSPIEMVDVADQPILECLAETDTPYQDLDVVVSELSRSNSVEHMLMAALYAPDRAKETAVSALLGVLRMAPNNELVHWNLLNSCMRFPEVPACSGSAIEDRAIDADGSNGLLWARISGLRMQRGDRSGAIDALRQATAAPRFSDYRMEHIGLFERGLAAVGNPPYRERIIQAIGMQSAMVSSELSVVNSCTTMAAESVEWIQQCVAFGERLENDGLTMLSVATGQVLQTKMYSVSGDTELLAAVEERKRSFGDKYQEPLIEGGEALLFYDDHVLANFFSNSATYGELRAYALLREDVERLGNKTGYDPCAL